MPARLCRHLVSACSRLGIASAALTLRHLANCDFHSFAAWEVESDGEEDLAQGACQF